MSLRAHVAVAACMGVLMAGVSAGAQPRPVRFGPRAADQPALAAWIAARIAAARDGDPQSVRVPLVLVSDGWGCPCPAAYLGDDPDSHGGADTWVEVELAPGVTLPTPPIERLEGVELSRGGVYRVDGHFTGEILERDLGHGFRYRLAVFRVTRVHGPVRDGARSRFRVALLDAP